MKQILNKIILGTILVGSVGFILLFAVLSYDDTNEATTAEIDPRPPMLLKHMNTIATAQEANQRLYPVYEDISADIKVNDESAASSRKIICDNWEEYCSRQYLDPLSSGVDLTAFIQPVSQ